MFTKEDSQTQTTLEINTTGAATASASRAHCLAQCTDNIALSACQAATSPPFFNCSSERSANVVNRFSCRQKGERQ